MGLDALRQRLSQAMENLVTLQIVTVVAEQIDLTNPKSIASGKAIRTRIRLDQGDIVTEMHPDFVVDEKLGAVLQFHTERENNAQQIIQRNLDVLGSVLSFATQEEVKLKAPPVARPAEGEPVTDPPTVE